jgi:hypothetical protein
MRLKDFLAVGRHAEKVRLRLGTRESIAAGLRHGLRCETMISAARRREWRGHRLLPIVSNLKRNAAQGNRPPSGDLFVWRGLGCKLLIGEIG